MGLVLGHSEHADPSALSREWRGEGGGEACSPLERASWMNTWRTAGGSRVPWLRAQASKAAVCDFAISYLTFEPLGRAW